MIDSIEIQGVASYKSVVRIEGLRRVNFFFGGNGTGKSTLSQALAERGGSAGCRVRWSAIGDCAIDVYNEKFKRTAFSEDGAVPGVFTLGEENEKTKGEIAKLNRAIESMAKQLDQWQESLNGDPESKGLRKQRTEVDAKFLALAWEFKKDLGDNLGGELRGGSNTRQGFMNALLNAARTTARGGHSLDLDELRRRAEVVFDDSVEAIRELGQIGFGTLPQITSEAKTLLATRVVGSTEVDLQALVAKLGHASWVDHGRAYLDEADGQCPFCQQRLPADFLARLDALFDQRYEEGKAKVANLQRRYEGEVSRIERQLDQLLEGASSHLDSAAFDAAQLRLRVELKSNVARLAAKVANPGELQELGAVKEALQAVNEIIGSANNKIREHNALVAGRSSAANQLRADLWSYLVTQHAAAIATHRERAEELDGEIKDLERKIQGTKERRKQAATEVRGLESTLSGTRVTAERINSRLKRCGFTGFQLSPTADERSYILVRPGRHEHTPGTLSEGERTFISFLYFHEMVRAGSRDQGAVTRPRVVVIDDPISSLDGEVMHVVSTLVADLMQDTVKPSALVRQVLVLTHNSHFHHTLSQRIEAPGSPLKGHITWWLFRKRDDCTSIECKVSNPVKTTYRMLWGDYFDGKDKNPPPASLPNTMRRIVEYYFKFLGEVSMHEVVEKLGIEDAQEDAFAKSLVSWLNDGSHGWLDDPRAELSPEQVGRFCDVFERLFKNLHPAHWQMMRKQAEAG